MEKVKGVFLGGGLETDRKCIEGDNFCVFLGEPDNEN